MNNYSQEFSNDVKNVPIGQGMQPMEPIRVCGTVTPPPKKGSCTHFGMDTPFVNNLWGPLWRTELLYEWGRVSKSWGGVQEFPPLLGMVWLVHMESFGLLNDPHW